MIWFREARAEDDAELTRLVAKPMPGELSLCMARDPSMLASCVKHGPPRRVLVAEREGDLVAVCTHFRWRYRVGERVREVWTVADFRAERRAAGLSVTGLGWRALRERLGGRPALVSLVKDNPLSLRLLGKARKGWPSLGEVARLRTFMLPLAAIPKVPPAMGLLQPSKEQIHRLLNQNRRPLTPVIESEDIGRVTPGEESFVAQHDGIGLSACGALWDPSEYRQIRIAGYHGLYRYCSWLLPGRGSEVRVRFASFLKGACPRARGNIFRSLVTRAREQGAQFLVWGGDAGETPPFPRYWPRFKMESSLYQLCWDGEDRLPFGECGYEVAWL